MITKTFTGEETFEAIQSAQDWCRKNGISFGSLCGDMPVGLMRGDYCIAKWKNLTAKERSECDGKMTSPDFRTGPVTIELKEAKGGSRD